MECRSSLGEVVGFLEKSLCVIIPAMLFKVDGVYVKHQFSKHFRIFFQSSITDLALSIKTDQRPKFQRMIKDSTKRLVDVLIVWKLDRFARDRYDSAHYKAIFKNNGVKVETISDGPEVIIFESMLKGMAEYYSANFGYVDEYAAAWGIHPEVGIAVVFIAITSSDGRDDRTKRWNCKSVTK